MPQFTSQNVCGFRTIPAPFSGCDSCGTGSQDCCGRRTSPSPPCGRRCGQHLLPEHGVLASHTHGRTAHAGAAPAAGRVSTCRSGTSSARTVPRRCAGRRAAGGRRSNHRPPARSSLGAGMVAAASGSRAITSGQNKKPAPTQNRSRGSCGAGTQAQALVDIHDGLFPADLAVNGQRPRPGLGIQPKDPSLSAARAKQPSVLCCQFIIFSH